jgi:hypothetical protein
VTWTTVPCWSFTTAQSGGAEKKPTATSALVPCRVGGGAVGVVRQQPGDPERRERDRRVRLQHAQDREREHAQRHRRAEPEPVDVDPPAEPGTGERDRESEREQGAEEPLRGRNLRLGGAPTDVFHRADERRPLSETEQRASGERRDDAVADGERGGNAASE